MWEGGEGEEEGRTHNLLSILISSWTSSEWSSDRKADEREEKWKKHWGMADLSSIGTSFYIILPIGAFNGASDFSIEKPFRMVVMREFQKEISEKKDHRSNLYVINCTFLNSLVEFSLRLEIYLFTEKINWYIYPWKKIFHSSSCWRFLLTKSVLLYEDSNGVLEELKIN